MVLQRAVGCCETVRRANVKLTLEQSVESETLVITVARVGMNGWLTVILRRR